MHKGTTTGYNHTNCTKENHCDACVFLDKRLMEKECKRETHVIELCPKSCFSFNPVSFDVEKEEKKCEHKNNNGWRCYDCSHKFETYQSINPPKKDKEVSECCGVKRKLKEDADLLQSEMYLCSRCNFPLKPKIEEVKKCELMGKAGCFKEGYHEHCSSTTECLKNLSTPQLIEGERVEEILNEIVDCFEGEFSYHAGQIRTKLNTLLASKVKEWNCKCEKPKPNGVRCIGKAEGNYQRCETCDRRIWS